MEEYAGARNAVEESLLAGFADRLGEANSRISAATDRIRRVADRLWGETPEATDRADKLRPVAAGIVGRLDSASEDLQASVERLLNAIKRLETL